MYEFLLQEEWWMDTIVSALISAGATLLIAYLAYADKVKNIGKDVEHVKEILNAHSNMFEKEHNKRSGEHKDLAGEHKELSGEHRELSKEHREIKDEIHQMLIYQESEKTARETASRKLPEESGLVNMANAVFRNNERLQQENIRLNTELLELQKENERLRAQVSTYQMDDSAGMDDMDIFNDPYDDQEL